MCDLTDCMETMDSAIQGIRRLAMLPAGLVWAFFPPPYVTVPGPVWLVLIPAVEVAVACAAIDVALTLGVELIVFAARAWHRDVRTID